MDASQIAASLEDHVPAVLAKWEQLVTEQPWFSLPRENRFDNLPGLIVAMARVFLERPDSATAHRRCIEQACMHGEDRRGQGLPEHLMFTEYHLLRQAIWGFLTDTYPSGDPVTVVIMRLDSVITVATNASMWGYHRPEIESMGKWEEGIERIVESAAVLRSGRA